jgi:hypothetical protein
VGLFRTLGLPGVIGTHKTGATGDAAEWRAVYQPKEKTFYNSSALRPPDSVGTTLWTGYHFRKSEVLSDNANLAPRRSDLNKKDCNSNGGKLRQGAG